jgi:hypothetical protein
VYGGRRRETMYKDSGRVTLAAGRRSILRGQFVRVPPSGRAACWAKSLSLLFLFFPLPKLGLRVYDTLAPGRRTGVGGCCGDRVRSQSFGADILHASSFWVTACVRIQQICSKTCDDSRQVI